MARTRRIVEPGFVYHVYNRRTDRQLLFPTPRDFDHFIDLLEDAVERFGTKVVAYCAMESHWHLGVWPQDSLELGKFVRWLSGTHAIRFRLRDGTRGQGHVYQDRFKSVVVETQPHYYTLVKYIEANPLKAGFVQRAEHWPWCSLADRLVGRRRILSPGPLCLPTDWLDRVNSLDSIES